MSSLGMHSCKKTEGRSFLLPSKKVLFSYLKYRSSRPFSALP